MCKKAYVEGFALVLASIRVWFPTEQLANKVLP